MVWGFAELEQLRDGIPVARFCRLVGLPRRTYYERRARDRDAAAPSAWPRPARERISERGLYWARTYPQWGHRKIWALIEPEHHATQSTVLRLLRDHDLLLPVDDRAQTRQLARVRRELFDQDFTRRNQVWQTDFTELETRQGGDWQMQPVMDYVTKFCLGCRVSTTQAAVDACAAIDDAIGAASDILRRPLLQDLTCPMSGQITPVIVVSDNGPAFKSIRFERFVLARPELRHVRTRKKSPHTNGVVECFNRTMKYEDLYRDLPLDGLDLDQRVVAHRDLYNQIRPHEGIGFTRPHDHYTAPSPPASTRQHERIP